MKKRWSVLIAAAVAISVVLATGTAMAAGKNRAELVRKTEAAQAQRAQSGPKDEAAAKQNKMTCFPPQAQQNNGVCPNHDGNCPAVCPRYDENVAGSKVQNDRCPYHEADCPNNCIWYNGKNGCRQYDAEAGICPRHDDGCCRSTDGGQTLCGQGTQGRAREERNNGSGMGNGGRRAGKGGNPGGRYR